MKVMVLVTATLFVIASGNLSENADVQVGAAYAAQVCASCHAVLPHQMHSPLPQAPSFQSIANTPGMTELALTVFIQSSHPTMPNIMLRQDELRNIVAYLRSLKRD